MPKTPDDLIKEYKDLYSSLSETRDIERIACVLYISIFERLKRKMRLDNMKVVKYIREDFNIQDKKRLQFREDDQTDDAYLCAQIQQAYRIFWTQVLNLSLAGNLCAKKSKDYFYPMDMTPQTPKYMATVTGRSKS